MSSAMGVEQTRKSKRRPLKPPLPNGEVEQMSNTTGKGTGASSAPHIEPIVFYQVDRELLITVKRQREGGDK